MKVLFCAIRNNVRSLLILFVISLFLLPVSGCVSGMQMEDFNEKTSYNYIHPHTNMEFQKKVASLTRRGIKKYDKEEKDVHIGYVGWTVNKPEPTDRLIILSVVVYEIRSDLVNMSEILDEEVELRVGYSLRSKGVSFRSEESVKIEKNGKIVEGRLLNFTEEKTRYGTLDYSSIDRKYIFPYKDKWFIKYMVSYPEFRKDEGHKEALAFIEALPWPE